jgi:hypothetical protein
MFHSVPLLLRSHGVLCPYPRPSLYSLRVRDLRRHCIIHHWLKNTLLHCVHLDLPPCALFGFILLSSLLLRTHTRTRHLHYIVESRHAKLAQVCSSDNKSWQETRCFADALQQDMIGPHVGLQLKFRLSHSCKTSFLVCHSCTC